MVKTEDSNKETYRNLLIPDKYQSAKKEEEIATFDKDGNYKCVRCGFTHTTTECAEYRLVHANRELEKIARFVHTEMGQGWIGQGVTGETPVDTMLRGFKRLRASWIEARRGAGESTEVTEMIKEE